jgi:hypothetical protein
MKIGWLTLAVLGSAACLASRGPTTSADAGADARDAHPKKETGAACSAPSGGNDLSFELDCTGECDVKAQIDLHLNPTDSAYPGCGVGGGNLELADLSDPKNPGSLTGTDQSSVEMDVTHYSGVGEYTLGQIAGNVLYFELSATPPCVGDAAGSTSLTLLIPEPTDTLEGGSLDAGVPPSCHVKVETDCTNDDGTHNVTGTLSCSFENAGAGYSCTLRNGKFQFGHCVP